VSLRVVKLWNLLPFPSIFPFKDKTATKIEKSRGKTKGREKLKQPGQGIRPPWPLLPPLPVVPCCSLPDRFCWFLNPAFCASFWPAGFALDHPSWAYWDSFATFLDLVWLNLHTFLLILGLIYVNLQLKTRTSQNQA